MSRFDISDINLSDMIFSGQLQNDVPLVDGGGGQTDSYATIVTTRCSLTKLNGSNVFPEGKFEYIKAYTLICRYQKAIVINATSRWLINGEYYSVDDWEKVGLIPQWYVMRVTKNQR